MQRKKARLSGSGSSKHQTHEQRRSSPVSDDEQTPAFATHERQLPPSTQYEIDRDAGFAHLENPELDDARATQKLLKRSELIGENYAADNGVIESVTMINFMCHERLHVTLGPLINFITGTNGSGKSAILTAITLCLGGKASTTNRGGSLKSFIKEGRDHASLIIHLKNQGADAYQPDVYGETIIVERNFSKTGTSGFKLKNANGRLVSNKKTDIEEIIEYFQLQIDNPMSILTQDNARQFITTSTPAIKYRYFVKGVQLEQLDNDYRLVSETADAMSFKLDFNRARVKKLKTEMDAAQEKVELVEKHAGMRAAVKKWSRQAAWAQVENEERNLRQREGVVTEAQAKIEQAEREAEVKGEQYQRTNDAVERAAEETQSLVDELVPLKDEESEAKAAFDAATQELHSLHLQQRQIKDHLDAAGTKRSRIKDDIDAEQRRIQDANGGAHAQRLSDLDVAQQKVIEAKRVFEDSALEAPHLEEQHRSAIEDLQNLKDPIERKKREISGCENQLQLLNRDVGQVMAGFDSKMPKLLQQIRNDGGFRERPVGPIGLHIRLLKPIWSSVLEKSIGNLLSGFIVTSKADQLRLSSMIRRMNLDFCPVIIGNHHSIDTTGHEPDQQYDTVLRVLDIDNDLVRRQLIINQGIEQTILVEKRSDAMRILYDGARPRNVKQCFCLHDKQRGYGIRLGFMPGTGDPSSSPIQPYKQKPRMKTDVESQIAYQKDTLQHLQRELRELEIRQRDLQQIVKQRQQAINQQKRAHSQYNVQLQRAEEVVEHLEDELRSNNLEDGRLEVFKADLREAEEEFRIHGGSYGEAHLAKDKQNEICSGLKAVLEAVKTRIRTHEAKIQKTESKARRIQQVRQIALQEKNIAIDAVNEAKLVKETAQQKYDRQAGVVASFIEQATKVCPRVPVDPGETMQSLDAKLSKLSSALKTYSQKLGGTDVEIHEACETAVRTYRSHASQLEGLENLLKLLKETYQARLERWRNFQRYISARSRTNFTYLLSERGFRGKLLLDHGAHLLDVQIEPDETNREADGRAAKTLSGGEKSFSSVCLLLSVWEAMGAPLRCLDEYDVFMDHVNRDVTTNLIVG